jgi:serine/threonine protein kinase
VYRARDTRLDRTVAVKVLPGHLSDNPEARQRFEREARSISSLNHANVFTLHDVGKHVDAITFAMAFQIRSAFRKGSPVRKALTAK